jgi:hypothetical protein
MATSSSRIINFKTSASVPRLVSAKTCQPSSTSFGARRNLFSNDEMKSLKAGLSALQLITTIEENHEPKIERDFLNIGA